MISSFDLVISLNSRRQQSSQRSTAWDAEPSKDIISTPSVGKSTCTVQVRMAQEHYLLWRPEE